MGFAFVVWCLSVHPFPYQKATVSFLLLTSSSPSLNFSWTSPWHSSARSLTIRKKHHNSLCSRPWTLGIVQGCNSFRWSRSKKSLFLLFNVDWFWFDERLYVIFVLYLVWIANKFDKYNFEKGFYRNLNFISKILFIFNNQFMIVSSLKECKNCNTNYIKS